MHIQTITPRISTLVIVLSIILAACQSQPVTAPEPIVETLVVTEIVEATPVEVIQVGTPTPEPGGSRTLVICMGDEPNSLYEFSTPFTIREAHIFEAIADGGWRAYNTNSFSYQPVILEKLPRLSDGDASLNVVTVNEGDKVVDAAGEVVILDPDADPPQLLIPAGGGGPVNYQGGAIEMDQLSATFKLLPDLLWSDGEPLTAADSKFTFELISDENTKDNRGYKFKVLRTASYQAIDDLTIVWIGLPGFMDSEYFINFFGPSPQHIWGEYSAAELYTAQVSHLKPVGWGPYVIDEWVQGESIRLHKNPNYFRAGDGLPKFDHLIFRFVGQNYNANIAALLSGECDILGQDTGIEEQSQLMLDLHRSGEIKATFSTGTAWEYLGFNIQHVDYDDGYQMGIDRPDFFSDSRTRQAFALCLDRQTVIDTLLLGQSPVINSYLPPQHPLYNPNLQQYRFDVTAGNALLEQVGWLDEDGDPATPRVAQGISNVPDGTRMEINYGTAALGIRPQVAAILQESLARCGIKANLKIFPTNEWVSDGPEGNFFGRKFDLGQFTWLTGVKPPCDLYISSQIPGPAGETWISIQDGSTNTFGESGWLSQNNPGFANEKYDQACIAALGSLPGQPEYEAAHKEAQRIFTEQLPVVPLYLFIKISATRPDLCGFIVDPTADSEMWNIEEFDYGAGCED